MNLQTLARAAVRIGRRLRILPRAAEDKEDLRYRYFSTAIDYYVAGRSAYFAHAIPTAGNILHHAVEMYLKGYLVRTHDESERRRLGHKLKKIWRRFKREVNDVALNAFDVTIRELDAFEELRYPERVRGWAVHFDLTRGSTGGISGPATRRVRSFRLILNEIDDLVAAVLKHASVNPKAFELRISVDGQNTLRRDNPTGIW